MTDATARFNSSAGSLWRMGLRSIRVLGFPGVPGFTLRSDRQDEYHVNLFDVLIKRHVASRTLADDQLSQRFIARPADPRAGFKQIKCGNYRIDPLLWTGDFMLQQVLDDSIEIFLDLRGEFNSRHAKPRTFGVSGSSQSDHSHGLSSRLAYPPN